MLKVPVEVIPKAKNFVIIQKHTPTNRFGDWIKENWPTVLSGVQTIVGMGK